MFIQYRKTVIYSVVIAQGKELSKNSSYLIY